MDYKGGTLRLQEKKHAWETQKFVLLSQISDLNASQREEKEVLEELMNQPFIHNEEQKNGSLVEELLVSMSQINLRDGEIKELRE